jgi:hypothetical protein
MVVDDPDIRDSDNAAVKIQNSGVRIQDSGARVRREWRF